MNKAFRRCIPPALILFAALATTPQSVAAYVVRGGEARAEIIIAESPARMTRLAAEEMQDALEKISGARLDILTEPTGERMPIYVGESRFTRDLGLNVSDLTDGAYRIAAGDGWLALLGPDGDFDPDRLEPWGRARTGSERNRINREMAELAGEPFRNPFHSLYMHYFEDLDVWAFDEEGTLNAVHAFLHNLGMRWYFPGELGEVVPTLADIPLPRGDRTVRPDFPVRDWYMYWMHTGFSEDLQRWHLRLGYNRGERWIGHVQRCHVMKYVNELPEFREKHPETTAVREGETPRAPAMCLSLERTFELHVKFVRFIFDHFEQRMVNIDPPDGFGGRVCQCEDCKAQFTPERGWRGAYSDYLWGYLDRVAREVHRSHPDRMVSGLAYSGYLLPPEKIDQMSPNLAVIHAMWRSHMHSPHTRAEHHRTRELWREKLPSGEWYTYDYYLHGRPTGGWAGTPAFFPRLIAEDLRALKGVSPGDTIEIFNALDKEQAPAHPFAVSHLNLYVTSRFWWDADQDLDALLEEYYTLFYGPARDEMKAFVEYGEENWHRMPREIEPIDRARELLDAAIAAVDPDSVYGRRIEVIDTHLRLLEPRREQLTRGREGPTIHIPQRPAGDLTLDGRLNDPFWEGVPEWPLRGVVDGEEPAVAATFRAAWSDNQVLVIGIRCEEPDMAGIRSAGQAHNDGQIWHGENVEIYLETPFHSYYQIAVNPDGLILDVDRSRGIHTGWSAEATAAVHRGENYWSVEIQLPAAGDDAAEMDPDVGIAGSLPTADAPWHFNIGRVRIRDDERELTSFSPTGRDRFGNRFRFAELQVEP